jgi:hypothetical protein
MEEENGRGKDTHTQGCSGSIQEDRCRLNIRNANYLGCDLFNVLSQYPTARTKNTSEDLRLERYFYFVQMTNKEALSQSYLTYS